MKKILSLLMLLTVAIPSLMATDFKKVTDVSELEAGANYLIVYSTTKAMGNYTTYRTAANISVTNDIISVSGNTVAVLELGGSEDAWTFKDISTDTPGFLQCDGSKNSIKNVETADNNCKFKLSKQTDGTFTIVSAVSGRTTYNYLQYNTSSPRFACYSNTQKNPFLYKEYVPAAVADPVITVTDGTYFVGDDVNVTLSCEDAEATIRYTTDGTEPTAETPTIGTSVKVTPTEVGSVTIKAIAVKNGQTSNVVSKVVAINPVATTVAAYNAMETGTIVRFDCDLTISYAQKQHIFAQDAAGNGVFMYSNSENGIGEAANGKVIPAKRLIGKVATYNSNKELNFSDYSLPTLTDGETIAPITVQFGALNDSYLYKFVMIPDVTLETGADAVLYNVNGVTGFLVNEYSLKNWPTSIDGKTFNIYGIYVIKGTERNLYFVDAKEVVVTLADPTLNVEGGTYDKEQTINITAADGAEVRYTTNKTADIKYGVAGTDYTVGNTLTIDKSCTLRVVAVKDGGFSPVVTETYVMKTATPVITVNDDTNLVTITTGYAKNVKVYYTLDRTTPVKGVSEEYTVPFVVDKETTINAIAVYGSFDESDVASVYYGDFVLYDFTDATIWGYTQPASGKNTQIDGKTLSIDETKPTISNTNGEGTKVRFYGISATQSVLRVYSKNTLTFKAPEGEDIYQIVFTYNDASKVFGPSTTCTTGNYDKNTGTWTGAANEVTFNISCSNANADIKWLQIMTTKVANSVVDINKKGALYTVNFELNGQAANGGVLYARTTDTSVEASKPNKNFFDKSYEDYDWEKKYDQRDWVAINGNTELVGKTLATGFIARYDGVKLTPVAAIADNGDAASYTLNTFGVANVFYGNYKNTETLGMKNDYRPFFVKAKVNEVANFVGKVTKDTNEEGAPFRLEGSGKCGVFKGKGVLLEAADGVTLGVSGEEYKQFTGVLVAETNNTLAQSGVKLVALAAPTTPTGVAALKADGKATVYGTEGAVVVNGADGKVMIFDAMGRMVKSVNAEGAATVAMPAGYYIVRTAGTAAKVMVK